MAYLNASGSPYDMEIVGIPKLLVKDFTALEKSPVLVVSKRMSGEFPASTMSLKREQTGMSLKLILPVWIFGSSNFVR